MLALMPPPPPQKGAGKGEGAVASVTKHGAKICKKFNDQRGCAAKCPKGDVHGCDLILLKSGEACANGGHNRLTHDPAKHGQVKPRQ